MRAHRDGMDPRIGAPRAEHLRRLGGEAVDRLFDGLLDAGAVGLPLPAHIGAAVIFDGEGETRHARRVPTGMARPRRNALVSIAGLRSEERGGGTRGVSTCK